MFKINANSGYSGYSKSRNAIEAEEDGSYPKSFFIKNYGIDPSKYMNPTSWHHTSKFFNITDYYSVESLINVYLRMYSKSFLRVKDFFVDEPAKISMRKEIARKKRFIELIIEDWEEEVLDSFYLLKPEEREIAKREAIVFQKVLENMEDEEEEEEE